VSASPSQALGLMPRIRAFVQEVARPAIGVRATVVRVRLSEQQPCWDRVSEGLAQRVEPEPILLRITSGCDIAREVGVHFGSTSLSAPALAAWNGSTDRTVLLQPTAPEADSAVRDYFLSFATACRSGTSGRTHLVCLTQDMTLASDATIRVVVFDQALSDREMLAYITLRNRVQDGPGSTHLVHSLIAAFAGWDVELAETLMGWNADAILSLPESLQRVTGAVSNRFSNLSWANKTCRNSGGSGPHALYELWQTDHNPPAAEAARLALQRRAWCAYVDAILPWLEARRDAVKEVMKEPINEVVRRVGFIPRKVGANENVRVDLVDVDYNVIANLAHHHGLVCRSEAESQGLVVCKAARDIRNAIAHLEVPNRGQLQCLISDMDRLLPQLDS
jgi:hypothetical protein